MFRGESGVGGWGYTCVNNSLKCSVSVHEIFTGKREHLTVIKFKKNKNLLSIFFLRPIFFKTRILNTAFLTIHFVKEFQNFEICFVEMPYHTLI